MKQLNVHELTEQPEENFEMIGEGGKVKLTRKYEVSDDVWFQQRPALYSRDKEYAGLTLRRYTSSRVEGGMRVLTFYYEAESVIDGGAPPAGGGAPQPTYSMDVSLSDEPLLAHKKFESVPDKERDALVLIFQGHTNDPEDDSLLKDKITSTAGLLALSKFKKGITGTKEPTVIWTERSTVKSLAGLGGIGKIDTPPGGPPSAGGRSWLNIGLTAQQSDDLNSFDQQKKWELSGPGGWDTDLYT